MHGTAGNSAIDVGADVAQLLVGERCVTGRDGGLEAAEVGPHRRGVAPVLEPLALRPMNPLFL